MDAAGGAPSGAMMNLTFDFRNERSDGEDVGRLPRDCDRCYEQGLVAFIVILVVDKRNTAAQCMNSPSLMPNLAPCVSPLSVAEVIVARSAKLVVFEHPNARERLVPLSAAIQNRYCDPSAMVLYTEQQNKDAVAVSIAAGLVWCRLNCNSR